MNIDSRLKLGSIEALVVRKPIKNLHLSVLPPNGWVRVTAPQRMNDDAIRALIVLRLPWIKKQQVRFAGQERQTKREYVSGESHYFLGRRYRLKVVHRDGWPTVSLSGKQVIILQVRPGSPLSKRRDAISNWYRSELLKLADGMLVEWQQKIGVRANFWAIKRMKTRWGICNSARGRITINLELAKKPMACIEYVIVHELLHLIEKKHNGEFTALLTKHLPKWKSTKEELNRIILSHEEW